MEGNFSLSTIADRETPAFNLVGELMDCLAVCMIHSVSRKAAGIQFNVARRDSEGAVALQSLSDLGTELDRISQNGFEAFSGANKKLNRIRIISGGMAQPGGSVSIVLGLCNVLCLVLIAKQLETLHNNFGKAGEAENNLMMLNRIVSDAKRYSEGIKSIEQQLKSWSSDISDLQDALRKIQRNI
jgi:hypothetical protein